MSGEPTRRRTVRLRPLLLYGCLALALVLGGCAKGPTPQLPPPLPLPPAQLPPPAPADRSALRDSRIAIDPGHGGVFPGSIGYAGLREADLNLDVSRLLADRLRLAGAAVLLTRDSDTDFVGRDSTRLRDDLEARAQKANAFSPDVFLSIHHNADALRDSSRNAVETYYRMSDAGPSVDVGSRSHRQLADRQGIARAELIPGNYYVLRRSTASAAVLGEASYLSNPSNEQRLLRPERRALEAGAYFTGLVEYFRSGVPRLKAMDPPSATLDTLPAALTAEIEDGPDGAQLDPSSVQAVLDDVPTRNAVVERLSASGRADSADTSAPVPGRLRVSVALPPNLSNGPHSWSVQARNLNGNALPSRDRSFELREPVASLGVRTVPPSIQLLGHSGGDMFEVVVEGSDARGLPVEGVEGRLSLSNGWFVLPDGEFVRDPIPFRLSGGVFRAVVRLSAHGSRDVEIAARTGGLVARAADAGASPPGTWFLVYAKSVCGDRTCALPGATVLWNGRVLGRTDAAGMMALRTDVRPGRLDSLEVVAPGHLRRKYLVRTALNDYTVDLGSGYSSSGAWPYFSFDQAVLPQIPDAALLRGVRVALDPIGPRMGTETASLEFGPDLNFLVARTLKSYLESVGAEVLLTRGLGDAPSAVARLRAVEKFGAQRLLLIDHDGVPSMGYNPGSNNARTWCEAQVRVWEEIGGGRRPAVTEDARYLMRQSSGLALMAQLGSVTGPPEMQSVRVRREALALYQGLVASLASPDQPAAGRMRMTFGHNWARTVVRVDENLLLDLDRDGMATLPIVAAGPHRVDANLDGEAVWAVVRVDSTGTCRVSDTDLRRYGEHASPNAGLPDFIFHQRYPEELSTRTRPVLAVPRETGTPR